MKRKINRILILSMIIGFSANPFSLKSQLIQLDNSIPCLSQTHIQYLISLNKWFNFNHILKSDWSSDEKCETKVDSLRINFEETNQWYDFKDSNTSKLKRNSSKKIRQKNFRNRQIVIQTSI